jgi:hypothetical protein
MREALVGFTTDRELHPAPKVKYLIGVIITQLYFDDAINRADRDALRRIMMTDTFNTALLVDDIDGVIAFADGLGRAFGYACATGDAIFSNFHGHSCYSY